MLPELAKLASLLASLAALYSMMGGAFFSPGASWRERLLQAGLRLAFAACVCLAGGAIFALAGGEGSGGPRLRLARTLPVRLLQWTTAATALLFAASWYLEEYYVPLLWRNQPH